LVLISILSLAIPPPIHLRGDLASPSWWDPDGVSSGYDWHYRVPVHISDGSPGDSVKVPVDFASLLSNLGVSGTFDANSVRVVSSTGNLIASQKFDDEHYMGNPDDVGNARGDVSFVLEDAAPVTYYIYFDIEENGVKPAPSFPDPSPVNLIVDGDFESSPPGTEDPTPWVGGGVANPLAAHYVVSGSDPHLGGSVAYSGTQSYKIGWDYAGSGPSAARNSMGGYVYQEITIPPSGATLTFCRRMVSYDYANFDRFRAQIRSTSNAVLQTLVEETAPPGGTGWKERPWKCFTFDLSAYAGQTIRVYFEAGNTVDALFGTYAYVDNVKVLAWLPAELGDPEGFGLDVVSVTNLADPTQPLKCGDTALVKVRSDVGLYLDSSDGSYLRAEIRDSSYNVVTTITLRDDGVPPDDVANDGIFQGTFTLPSVLDESGGTWTVIAWPGDPPDYDNGYHVSDSLQFVVEGLDATPEDISATVVEGTPVQVTITITNVGVQDAEHVKLMVDPAGGVDPSYVSFSSNDFTLAAGDSTDVVMTISVPAGDPTGTFSTTIYVFDDENLNDLPDDCRVDSLTMTLTIEPPPLYVTSNPASTSSTVQPKCEQNITKYYYVVSFHNSGTLSDIYDLSVKSDRSWNVSVYLDSNGDDSLGLSDSEPASFSDDILIAYDLNGDSTDGWTYVNGALDTNSDGIPDTGNVASGGSVNIVFVIYLPRDEVLVGDNYNFRFRASSYNDWQTNHPSDPYYDDDVVHADSFLTLNIGPVPCGFIDPDSGSVNVSPLSNVTVSFVQNWINVAPGTDRGNVKIMENNGSFSIRLLRDEGLNDPTGAFNSSASNGDDVLLAEDSNGDGVWDIVSPDYDSGGDGIPDTGDLTPHGGLARMVFLMDVPRRTPPGNYWVVIRGSSNLDWQTNYPTDPYYADEIFHDEAVLDIKVLPVAQPDLIVTFPNGTTFWDDIYDPVGTVQYAAQTQKSSETTSYVVTVENDGNQPDTILVRMITPGNTVRTVVFDGASNVTNEVTSASGYPITLNPGERRDLVVTVTPLISRDRSVLNYYVEARSSNDPMKEEKIRANLVILDDIPPVIVLASPADGSTVEEGDVTFFASIHDDTGIKNATITVFKGSSVVYQETKDLSGQDVSVNWTFDLKEGAYYWCVTSCDTAEGRQNCVTSSNFSLGVKVPVQPVGRAPPAPSPVEIARRYGTSPFKLYTYFSPPSAEVGDEVEIYILLEGWSPVGGRLTYKLPYGLKYIEGSSLIDGRKEEPVKKGRELMWRLETGNRVIRFKAKVTQAAHGTLWGEAWVLNAVGTSPLVIGRSLPEITPPQSATSFQLASRSRVSASVILSPTLARVGSPVKITLDLKGDGKIPVSLKVSDGLRLANSTDLTDVSLPANVTYEVIPSQPGVGLVRIMVGNETVSIPLPVVESEGKEGSGGVVEVTETRTVTRTETQYVTVTKVSARTGTFRWEWAVIIGLSAVILLLLKFGRRRPPFSS